MMMPATIYVVRRELGRAGARRRLDDRRIYRAIAQAVDAGLPQREISDRLATGSQATVHRIIQRLAANPDLIRETPSEIIDSRAAGDIDTSEMMERLTNWQYSFGAVPRIDGFATDAYQAGDWDEIKSAHYRDLITDDEFAELARRQKAEIEEAVRSR